jgi:ribosomal protein L11 methyltransferase
VAAYEVPPVTLPAGLGSWRVEPVDDARLRVWEERPHGVVIAGRLWVGPPSEPAPPGLSAVTIDARQAFGSGAHGTTSGCLELLCEVEPPLSVLDIAAAKLGHGPVYACDVDPLSVGVAAAAGVANGVEVETFVADALHDPLPACQLWIANLLGGPVADLLARDDAPERVIISGLVEDEELNAPAYAIERRIVRAGWQAFALRRR